MVVGAAERVALSPDEVRQYSLQAAGLRRRVLELRAWIAIRRQSGWSVPRVIEANLRALEATISILDQTVGM